jgi:hypothetical protein
MATLSVNLATISHSLTHYTKGTQSPCLRKAPTACTFTVSDTISLPSLGYFSPFPHGTSSLSVSREYLALEDGPPIFNQDTTCPDLLFVTTHNVYFEYRTITLYGWPFQTILLYSLCDYVTGLFRFRSSLLTESRLISFPLVTKIFQFSRFASVTYVFSNRF